MELVAMIEAGNDVTLLVSGVERANLTYNHPLSSYKVDRITRKRFKRVETPSGSSGHNVSTQGCIWTPPR